MEGSKKQGSAAPLTCCALCVLPVRATGMPISVVSPGHCLCNEFVMIIYSDKSWLAKYQSFEMMYKAHQTRDFIPFIV